MEGRKQQARTSPQHNPLGLRKDARTVQHKSTAAGFSGSGWDSGTL